MVPTARYIMVLGSVYITLDLAVWLRDPICQEYSVTVPNRRQISFRGPQGFGIAPHC
jgi:hypothetical protein